MRLLSLIALGFAIALTAGLALADGEEAQPHASEGPPRYVMPAEEPTTTSTTAVVLDNWIGGIDQLELEEIEAKALVVEQSTTTTTAPPTTTTTTPRPTNTTKPKPPPTTTTTTAQPSGNFNSGFESDFYSRINSLRSSNGLAPLTRSGELDSMARSWAKWMGTHQELAHSKNPNKLFANGWSIAGETVGKGGSVSSVFEALANSGGHRSIMLGEFTHVGVGAWVDADGTVWTAHLFAG